MMYHDIPTYCLFKSQLFQISNHHRQKKSLQLSTSVQIVKLIITDKKKSLQFSTSVEIVKVSVNYCFRFLTKKLLASSLVTSL